MKIISICNQKGGVGKTTTTMNLAAALVQKGLKVLCIDLDSQGNLSGYLGYRPDRAPTIVELLKAEAEDNSLSPAMAIRENCEGICYIPSDIRLSGMELQLSQIMFREQLLSRILSDPALQIFDYILIDCLPSLGVLLSNALIASDWIIIPVQAQQFALDGLDDLMSVCGRIKRRGNPRLSIAGVLLTMTDNTVASRMIEADLRERFGNQVFRTSITRLVEAVESTMERRSLLNSANSRLGAQYTDVAGELLKRI